LNVRERVVEFANLDGTQRKNGLSARMTSPIRRMGSSVRDGGPEIRRGVVTPRPFGTRRGGVRNDL
jgi:hypothetical protein